jgi:SAM-dependent methyltransferase
MPQTDSCCRNVKEKDFSGSFLRYNKKDMRGLNSTRTSNHDREFTYDGIAAKWWAGQAANAAHRRAYKNIADFVHRSFPRSPKLIVDYACGEGTLLCLLSRRFEQAKLVGLDGSAGLLSLAKRRLSRLPLDCARRIELIHTPLPRFNLLKDCADLVVFCFPNMMPSLDDYGFRRQAYPVNETDRRVARTLSLVRDSSGRKREFRDPSEFQEILEQSRCISRNLRRMLVRGGICVRVEYATTRRHEWSLRELQTVSFEEGTLDMKVDGASLRTWFRVLASAYFRSGVLEDVYQQSGSRRDKNGGYLITVLRAL